MRVVGWKNTWEGGGIRLLLGEDKMKLASRIGGGSHIIVWQLAKYIDIIF